MSGKPQEQNTDALRPSALGDPPGCLAGLSLPFVILWSFSQFPCGQNRK